MSFEHKLLFTIALVALVVYLILKIDNILLHEPWPRNKKDDKKDAKKDDDDEPPAGGTHQH